MILRRIGIGTAVVLLGLTGLWVAALRLPDAPGAPGVSTRLSRGAGWQAQVPARGVDAPGGGAQEWGSAVLAVPVQGVRRETIRDSWGDPRDNGLRLHHGTDLMAPAGTPILAAAPGTVEKLWASAAGGTTLYVRSPARTWTYYYAHLAGYAPGLHEGQPIATGQVLGYVGDTGNAGAGNFHLHFGLSRTTPAQHWYQGEDVDPYPYLAGKPLPR